MAQLGGFLGRLFGPLLKTGLPLMRNVVKPLSKSVLIPLGLTTEATTANVGMHKKVLVSGYPGMLAWRPLDLVKETTLAILMKKY